MLIPSPIADEVATNDVKPLTFMTTKLPQRSVNGLLCSLLNTVCGQIV